MVTQRAVRNLLSSAPVQPEVIRRSDWVESEAPRFDIRGAEIWPPAFAPLRMAVVHHTHTRNDDPDPVATLNRIYRFHALDRGWGDIGYNFMIDEVGAIYEGRWSGAGAQQWPSEDEDSRAVVAGHVYGCNEGSCGIALLGDFDEQPPTSAAISALVELLAHLSARHGFAAVGLGIPVMTHLHLRPVTCPGRELFGQLPSIREEVASRAQST